LPDPEDCMVSGLLCKLGALVMQQAFPMLWRVMADGPRLPPSVDRCTLEESVFGFHHIEVTAALLEQCRLPEEIVAPIRSQQVSHQLTDAAGLVRDRAKLLYFSRYLADLDQVVKQPRILK